MSEVALGMSPRLVARHPGWRALGAAPAVLVEPNALVRLAFYASIAAIPFARLYLPGTGDRLGVIRIVQLLIVLAALSQPRVCLRLFPVALLWFAAYCALRVGAGFWLSPELVSGWWPTTFEMLQLSLPWVWFTVNVLQFPNMRQRALWVLVWSCCACALLHLLGLGVTAVDAGPREDRTTIFGENANVVGATYAVAIISAIGLSMLKNEKLSRRLLSLPLVGILGLAMAKTGSRTAMLLVLIGSSVLLFQAPAFATRTKRYGTLILAVLVMGLVVWRTPTVLQRFQEIDTGNIDRENPRARMAPVLWEIFLRSPVYGSGPDHYQFELTRRAMPYLIRDQRTIAAHNLVLLLLVETGLLGLFLFAAGLGMVLAAAWRGRKGATGLLPLALVVPFVLAGMVVSNPVSNQVFWLGIAYALAGTAVARESLSHP